MPANRNSPWTRRLIIGAGLLLCILSAWWFAGGRTIATRAVLRSQLGPLIEIMNQPDIPGENRKSACERVFYELIQHLHDNPKEVQAGIEYLALGPSNPRDALSNQLPGLLFFILLENSDRAGLVELLASQSFYVVGPGSMYIEFVLVEPYSSLPVSNILILFDAYDRATSHEVKKNLIEAIRRAFHDRIKPGETDSEVVRRMRREFERDADHLQVNKQWRYAYLSGFFDSSNFVPPPLFIDKSGPDDVEGSINP